jgi:uncharacterized protein
MTLAEALFRNDAASAGVADVCRQFHVRRLDIFGSAATGRGFDPACSDLDFLVTFEPLAPVEYADAFFGLREALEALSGRPIDLVTDAALENPYLRRRVESERHTLFRAP